MKSFWLHIGSKREGMLDAIGIMLALPLVGALHYFHIAEPAWRMTVIIGGAILVGSLCRGSLCRGFRLRYPNARWLGLLAVGWVLAMFGVFARFIIRGADDRTLTLALLVPGGGCIATFLLINQRDPDVWR